MTRVPLRKTDHAPAVSVGPGQRVLIVGLGVSGLWTARWLIGRGAQITVSDMKKASDLDPAVVAELTAAGVALETGGHREETFTDKDTIVVSPGVPHDIPAIRAASEKGIPVIGEMELASRFIATPIIAVTGTNGKTTVTAMVGEMLKHAGLNVFVGGNIGTPLMAYAAGAQEADYLVVEVSSFQLDTIETFSPHVSVVLNITPDHLDRYADMATYVQSKLRIYENQEKGDWLILNDDDPRLSSIHPEGVTSLRYGLGQKEGLNAFLDYGTVKAALPGESWASFTLERFALPGSHNQENVLAVVLVGMALNIDTGAIQETIDRFKGLPHRIACVGEAGGVRFYNDSKATNVDAARRAIGSLDAPLVLIAGGRHKGADYGPLVEAGHGKVKGVVFLGEARDLLKEAFAGAVPYVTSDSMEDAVRAALSMAQPGDVVLLAPACASFDMFTDYRHRGEAFAAAVKGLDHG
jgi:UDP-N-acetylmuramoylalanine--D-glutamate ligase